MGERQAMSLTSSPRIQGDIVGVAPARGAHVHAVDLAGFGARHGVDLATLPRSLRIMLEAALRACADGRLTEDVVVGMLPGGSDVLAFPISRVILQDAAGLPLLVDLAALRDAVHACGLDAEAVRPQVPVALVIDHSVEADLYGSPDALDGNTAAEFVRNAERYSFVKWAQQAFPGLTVVPPGNGIVHQVHLEQIAEIVSVRDGWILCDSVIGTDSHTTMVNGLGMLGWGVGGIEAEAALLGDPQDLARPEFVEVELFGQVPTGSLAADVALLLTERLRAEAVVGAFLEFSGAGLDGLSVADRCTIANMAPEYGASLALFPTDEPVLGYLLETGRSAETVALIRDHLQRQGLFGREATARARYDRTIRIDLGGADPCVAGPSRPDQRMLLPAIPASLAPRTKPLDGQIALAAITSCTNTANPAAVITAALLARNAVARGLQVQPDIKTVFAPGSRRVTHYLEKLDLLRPLEELGFAVAAYGCAVCVGNTGRLAPPMEDRIARGEGQAVAVLSGNRNFEGRVHPSLRAAYLMSPPLVVAYALAGHVRLDLSSDVIGRGKDGEDVFLRDIWPNPEDVGDALARLAGAPGVLVRPEAWDLLPVSRGPRFAWSETSSYFVKPPFFARPLESAVRPIHGARPLLVLGDAITTDHISPVGPIAPGSPAARYLTQAGVRPAEWNSYAARRGNHHIMARGTFANIRLRNLLVDAEGPETRHLPSGDIASVFETADRYAREDTPLVILAGARYGSGSARDWAAKGTALLGVRAVVAASFERIHRSNLVRLGVLPVELDPVDGHETFLQAGFAAADLRVDILFDPDHVSVRAPCEVVVTSPQAQLRMKARLRIDTPTELALLRSGDLFRHAFSAIAGRH